jgi:NitT/TauT family transport system ATP-binding protein
MIALEQVGFRYGEPWVVRGLTARIEDGGVLRLAGPNGSGKTTVLGLILGVLTPAEGRIEGLAGRAKSAVFQKDRLIQHLSALANVRLVLRGGASNAELTSEFDRIGLAREALKAPVRELSGGQRRRVAIVRGLMAESRVVGLDEPFTGIDQEGREQVLSYVRERLDGRDTILITHDESEAKYFGGTLVDLPRPAPSPDR